MSSPSWPDHISTTDSDVRIPKPISCLVRKDHPTDLVLHFQLGKALFESGDFDGAIGAFTKVWAIDPDYHNASGLLTKAYLFVGMQFYSDHKYTEAIDIWQKALIVDPANNKAKRYLSKAHEELQKLSGVYRVK